MRELYLFLVPTLHEADKISRPSLDSDLFSAKSLTNALPTCPSVSTLGLSGLVFVIVQAVIS